MVMGDEVDMYYDIHSGNNYYAKKSNQQQMIELGQNVKNACCTSGSGFIFTLQTRRSINPRWTIV